MYRRLLATYYYAFSFALMTRLSHSFLPITVTQSTTSSTTTTLKSKNELFDSPGWESIREELDQVPIFAVANAEGQPLKYSIQLSKKNDDDGDGTFEVPLFYTHVEDALKELENARKSNPLPGMDMYVICEQTTQHVNDMFAKTHTLLLSFELLLFF